jgi:hypothetical protein
MQDFEKLGAFYLGAEFDQSARKRKPELVLYDSKDLTTHAVCVGMTGSGKTGLCLTLLEEAAIDNIPAIAIDPKGDLGNLLLTFPNLQPGDFRPWVDESEATRLGITPDQLAEQTASKWKNGLEEWGQDGARIERLRAACDMAIYTPGSNVGLPLTVLQSFAAPPQALVDDADAFRERISAAASGLLALLGIDADPVRSREHILLANLLERAWRERRDLDLPGLLREIQSPPFDKVGFVDLETFFPMKDRSDLSMRLNNILASPAFAGWLEGEPLNIGRLLHTAEGKPRLSIISIAHLSDAERMFFVTILLNEILAWVRSQPGTSSLRALLYMDEVFGYFPPTANPPSKTPMLTLLKQARAYGLGIVLATQNPVDLDYKSLSNAGTWFLGRLQTERDKMRVLEGLEGASSAAGANFDRQKMEAILAGLGQRVFLMNNVHENQPVVFETRWTLSYLRGPLARSQIQKLMAPRKKTALVEKEAVIVTENDAEPGSSPAPAPTPPAAKPKAASHRPILPAEAGEQFIPVQSSLPAGTPLQYYPALLGTARLHFVNAKADIDLWKEVTLFSPLNDDVPPDPWEHGKHMRPTSPALDDTPNPSATFALCPAVVSNAKSYAAWRKALPAHMYACETLKLWKHGELKLLSTADETEADFRVRLQHRARELRDADVEKLRQSYAQKVATAENKRRSAADRVAREESQLTNQSLKTVVSVGSTILGALFGRKTVSRTNISGAATAIRGASRTASESGDVNRAKENLAVAEQKLEELKQEITEKISNLDVKYRPESLNSGVEEVLVRPRKSDIAVRALALVWMPCYVDAAGNTKPAI